MHGGNKVICVHGHMSTPYEFTMFSVGLVNTRKAAPGRGERFELSDERLETSLSHHLQVLDVRNVDVQMISPRPVHMWHWEVPEVQIPWCRTTNDVIHQSCKLHPDRFLGMGQLPQNSKLDTRNCIEELERCVKDLGFVGAIVNPDPAGDSQTPGMNDEYWFPLYEKAQELGAVLMIHSSSGRDRRVYHIPQNYQVNNVVGQYVAMLSLEHSNVFEIFPRLHVFVCHMGGALNRFLLTDDAHKFGNKESGKDNLWFDSCVLNEDFLSTAIKQKTPSRVLFGCEAPGAGAAVRPETGKPGDDLVPVIDKMDFLTSADKQNIFNGNAKKFFPLLKVQG